MTLSQTRYKYDADALILTLLSNRSPKKRVDEVFSRKKIKASLSKTTRTGRIRGGVGEVGISCQMSIFP